MLPYVFYLIHNLLELKNSLYSRGARGVPLCHSSNVVASVGDMCAIRCPADTLESFVHKYIAKAVVYADKVVGVLYYHGTGAVRAGIYTPSTVPRYTAVTGAAPCEVIRTPGRPPGISEMSVPALTGELNTMPSAAMGRAPIH